jgi:hypothetical protein
VSVGSDQQVGTQTAEAIPGATRPTQNGSELLTQFPPQPVASSWSTTETGRSQMVGRALASPSRWRTRSASKAGDKACWPS